MDETEVKFPAPGGSVFVCRFEARVLGGGGSVVGREASQVPHQAREEDDSGAECQGVIRFDRLCTFKGFSFR